MGPLSVPNGAAYRTGVRRVKRSIAAGDIYQANLTHAVAVPFAGNAAFLFHRLNALNPSPYGFYMEAPGWALVGGSPELLLRVRGDRLQTRPIAGTRPRGATPGEDRRLRGALLLSPKERAEHVMLVDLARNDLGRVGNRVRVTERMVLESYSHVTHIVSQVEGRLARGFDGLDALGALFPGGTITGCPKLKAMETLARLEGVPRGPFYGAAGWVADGGEGEWNLLIRTAVVDGGVLTLRVGAGIVADSRPEREWQETLHKAGAFQAALEERPSLP
jgi:para-aminobenzoate synthetase component 1